MIFRLTEEFIYSSDEYHEFMEKQKELNDADIKFSTNITTSAMSIICSTGWSTMNRGDR